MLARWAGVCAACGGPWARGDEIKLRFTYDKQTGGFVRVPDRYSHKSCPKVTKKSAPMGVDPETGEVIGVFQRVFGDAEVPYDEALSDSQEPPERPESIKRKKPMRRAGVEQERLFEAEVDKVRDPT